MKQWITKQWILRLTLACVVWGVCFTVSEYWCGRWNNSIPTPHQQQQQQIERSERSANSIDKLYLYK